MEQALSVEFVAERLGVHVNTVYRHWRKLGGVQLRPRGRILFFESKIREKLEQGHALSTQEWQVESYKDDKRQEERKNAPHRTRSDSLGRVSKRRRVGSVRDEYNVLGMV